MHRYVEIAITQTYCPFRLFGSTRLNGWGKFYFMTQIILNTMCYCHLIDVIGIVLIFALLISPILYLIHRESRNNGK